MSQSLWLELALRSVHFLGIFGLVGGLVTQNVLLKKTLPVYEIKRLAKIDSLYGLSALVVLVAGLLLWLGVGKPSAFYSHNPVFLIKLTLFVCVALASLFPTVYFLRNQKNKATKLVIPAAVRLIIRIELLVVLLMPILAVFMARGIGLGTPA